jgi:CMP-N-acetylneuraminic acid synthetase
MGERPLVTVYVPCHNYGRFLKQAVQSVLRQSWQQWELFLIDEASHDETAEICEEIRRSHPDRVEVLRHPEPRGLQACANEVLRRARGKYIVRLDADDWLDESALLVMADLMERRPEVALVFPNYIYVNAQGKPLGVESRKAIGREARLLDLPAHGACTLVRRRVLKAMGGYDETQIAQDGYELWLKISRRYEVASVETPLFFYRQHDLSMSRDETRILTARGRIKRAQTRHMEGPVRPRVLGLVPAKNTYRNLPNIALAPVGGRPLIDHTLDAARACPRIDHLVVTTDCRQVVHHCHQQAVETLERPLSLSRTDRTLSEVVFDAVERLEAEPGLYPDIVVVLSIHCPLRTAATIEKALDSLLLYDADSVISVYEDYDVHFTHGPDGLTALNPAMMQRIRLEREGLYVFNGAVTAVWRDVIASDDYHGQRISHVVTPRMESFQLKSQADRELLDFLLTRTESVPCSLSPKSA